MVDVCRFWLDLGIDGFRLDAVPYLYARDGTNCENLPETHAFIAELRAISSTGTACSWRRPISGRRT
jgi:maltose alpha-D-glucosyltransferase/alpha-amylase